MVWINKAPALTYQKKQKMWNRVGGFRPNKNRRWEIIISSALSLLNLWTAIQISTMLKSLWILIALKSLSKSIKVSKTEKNEALRDKNQLKCGEIMNWKSYWNPYFFKHQLELESFLFVYYIEKQRGRKEVETLLTTNLYWDDGASQIDPQSSFVGFLFLLNCGEED